MFFLRRKKETLKGTKMPLKISIVNQKGGVGKTNIAFNLSGALAEKNKKILLIDLDQQGNLSSLFFKDLYSLPATITDLLLDSTTPITEIIYTTAFPNIDIIPSNTNLNRIDTELASEPDAQYSLADSLKTVEPNYDIIIIDCPPSLGLATLVALVATDYVIIPLECEQFSIRGNAHLTNTIIDIQRRVNPTLQIAGYLISKFNQRRAIEQAYRKKIREIFKDKVFSVDLKDSVKYAETITRKKPITFLARKSEQAETYRKLALEILNHA